MNVKEMQEGLHESLLNHSHEYDSLYSEHEEEVSHEGIEIIIKTDHTA